MVVQCLDTLITQPSPLAATKVRPNLLERFKGVCMGGVYLGRAPVLFFRYGAWFRDSFHKPMQTLLNHTSLLKDLSFRAKQEILYEICLGRFHEAIAKALESVKERRV
jgi:hypothetical protein